jgi:DNA-directed RNA polymerase specialized sigma subunit
MEKIRIEKILREYKTKKSLVETTNARIEAYRNAINNPDLITEWSYSESSRELGMPGSPTRNTLSPVEKAICEKELTIDIMKDWINEDNSRIFRTRIEVSQIETALTALTKQERYIVECKYFERMSWRDIEINFNQQFRHQNYITESGIRKINVQAVETLKTILEAFYDKVA